MLLPTPKKISYSKCRTTIRMLESLIRLDQAHARLMFRNEVTQLDAITAILCIESSMTTLAIVDSVGNALHSNFMDNPDQECILDIFLMLKQLAITMVNDVFVGLCLFLVCETSDNAYASWSWI
ncbi:hypothetical protein ACS0TY_022512 [Phlomoides rotata]